MQTRWKTKNKQNLTERIRTNEKEILRINNYLNSFFASDAETSKMQSNITALEVENQRLEKMEPSELSPDEIISLTKPALFEIPGLAKKKPGSSVKVPFVDATVVGQSKFRHALWKLVLNEWQYKGYE
ncbi:MAG: hypothetical protein ABR502_11715 [Chitinophagaceae bacterium]